MIPKQHFQVHEGQNGKFYLIGMMGEQKLTIPLTKKDLAKKVARDLNNQLRQYSKEFKD